MPNMLTSEDLKAISKIVEKNSEEILEAVNKGSQYTQDQISGVETSMKGVETRLTGVETRLKDVETNMATKDFVERRLARTDGKINSLVNVMEKKRVITEEEKRAVLL